MAYSQRCRMPQTNQKEIEVVIMKKTLSLILALLLCLSLCGCKDTPIESEKTIADTEATDTEATDTELAQAVALIESAEAAIISAASIVLDDWIDAYFVDSSYNYLLEHSPNWAKKVTTFREYRSSAKEKLEKAKDLIGSKGSSDYYTAVKEYYKSVTVLLKLITDNPTGLTLGAYSLSLSDQREICANTYAEVEFYQ